MTGRSTPALDLRALHMRFGRTQVLCGVNLAVRKGERVAVIGPNGAGKSTLFDVVTGRHAPTSGQVLLNGKPIEGKTPFQIHRLGLSRSFQITNLFPNLTVFQNLRCALLWRQGYRYSLLHCLGRASQLNERVAVLAQSVGLSPYSSVPAGELSYAQQRALELGIAFACEPSVVLLDEPTAGMSALESADCVALIRRMTQGRTLMVVEHDMDVVFDLADRIAVLVQGELLAFDTPDAVRADARVQEAYLGVPQGPAASASWAESAEGSRLPC